MAKTMIDAPLSELTFRKYEKPENMAKRTVVKKLCLSLGLLQPGDSRDVIVDIFHTLIIEAKNEKFITSEEVREKVIELREKEKLPLIGIASSNVRRQLKRLRDIFLVEKIRNKYRVTEFQSLSEIFQDKVMGYLLPSIITRVKDYISEIDSF